MINRPIIPSVNTSEELRTAVQAALDRIASDINRAISSPLDAKSARVTGVGKPAAAQDAVPLGYLRDELKRIESSVKASVAGTLNELVTPTDSVGEVNITNASILGFAERNTKVLIQTIYDHPVSGEFSGVAPVFEWYDGHTDTDVDKPAVTALIGTCTTTIPRPSAGGLGGYIHLLAYNTASRKKYVDHNTAPVERWENIAISQALLDANPVNPDDVTVSSPAPTGVTIDGDDTQPNDYNLLVQWSAAGGGVAGYDIQIKTYSDSGLTTVVDDWTQVSSVYPQSATSWRSDRWAKRGYDMWVKARVRSYHSGVLQSAWVESSGAKKISKSANFGQVTSQVTSLVLSTNVNGEWPSFFQIQLDWSNPADLSAVVGVRPEYRYYTDAGGTTPLTGSEWGPLGNRLEILTQYKTAWLQRPVTTAYLKCRLALINAIDEPGPYTESNLVLVDAVVPPAAPASVSVVLNQPVNAGVKQFGFTITITPSVNKLDTDWYETWVQYYSDAGGATPVGEWIYLGGADPAVNVLTTDLWNAFTTQYYYKIRVAAKAAQGILSSYVYSTVGALPTASGILVVHPNAVFGTGTGDLRVDANGRIYINDVDLSKAYNYSTEFTKSGGVMTISTLAANKIVTGTLGAGVVYAGQINASQINAGTLNGFTITGAYITALGTLSGVDGTFSGIVYCGTAAGNWVSGNTGYVINGTNGVTATPVVMTAITVTTNSSWPGTYTGTFSDPPTNADITNLKNHLNNLISDLGGTVVRSIASGTTTMRYKGGICTGTS